jgi:hypothetical protein
MTYTLTSSTLAADAQTVIRDADGANIPPDPRNADFQAYLAWLGAGNTPTLYKAPAATPQSIYDAAMAAGIEITSTATPTLNAAYAIDPTMQQRIQGIVAGITAGKGLPGGGSTFEWEDQSAIPHVFTSADFVNFAAAVENYVYGLIMTLAALKAGQPATWPTAAATIP